MDANGNPQTTFLTSIQQYQRGLLLQQAGFNAAQIQALGGGPSRFGIQAGQSYISAVRWDAGPFIQDDWRMRPNLTLSLGLRYEVQTLVSDHKDIAPRIGFAWAPGNAKNGRQKTVIRGGIGIFYDRINTGHVRDRGPQQRHQSTGLHGLQPDVLSQHSVHLHPQARARTQCNSSIPSCARITAFRSAIGVERQLPHNTTVALTYTNNRSNHLAQTVNINTPLPGTFNPLLPLSATNGAIPARLRRRPGL